MTKNFIHSFEKFVSHRVHYWQLPKGIEVFPIHLISNCIIFYLILFFRITMSSIVKVITALVLIAVLSIDKTESVCCKELAYVLHHVCLGTAAEDEIPLHWFWDHFLFKKIKYWMRSEKDAKQPKCVSPFCEDGLEPNGRLCGVGDCNIFGCDCKGGCRKNNGTSYKDLAKNWREQHGLLVKKEHVF